MGRDDLVQFSGKVTEKLAGGNFKITLDQGERQITAILSGKLRKFHIRIIPGDRVTVGFSPYDMDRGLILFREQGNA